MPFELTANAKKRALKVAREHLFRYLSDNPATFCPFVTKILVRNVRDCIKQLDDSTENKENLLKLSRITAVWLTRAKRVDSLKRLVKLLARDQRASLRETKLSLLHWEAGLHVSPAHPVPEGLHNALVLEQIKLEQDAAVAIETGPLQIEN